MVYTCLSFCPREGVPSPGGSGLGRPGPGVCLVPGGGAWSGWLPGLGWDGVPGPGRGSGPGGGGAWSGDAWSGGCLVETPQMTTAAGGTHPTGMHSCLVIFHRHPHCIVCHAGEINLTN